MLRDLVAVAPTGFGCVARRQRNARFVKQLAGKLAGFAGPDARASVMGIAGELDLHGFPGLGIDDRLVLAFVHRTFVGDLPNVERVREQLVEGAAAQWAAAAHLAAAGRPPLGREAAPVRLLLHPADRAVREVKPEEAPHGLGLSLVDHQAALAGLVAQRHEAAHPHAFGLGGGDLVADALAGDLALELGEGEQHVERQAAHRGCGVELLGHRDEGDAVAIEDLDDLGEVGERAGQAVDLVDHDRIDLADPDVGEQLLEGGPLQGAAGEAAVVVACAMQLPALAGLALDEGFAGLALGVERVEALLQPLLGRLAGVDGTAQALGLGGLHRPLSRSPKKRGPDQRAPVISRAICDRLA